ncbi:MAG: four helix bundle protein [bacterium]|nr:four helix bundle protein [bacterium]
MNKIHSYKDLVAWQRAMEVVVSVYTVTNQFPKSELYGLTSQARRAAISIPSNIAEGRLRRTKTDYMYRLSIAYSSGAELETQIEIAKRLPFGSTIDFSKVDSLLNEVMRMLNKMINSS